MLKKSELPHRSVGVIYPEAMFFDYLNRVIRFHDGKWQITWEQLLGVRTAT